MNCLEFRRNLLTEPGVLDASMEAHIATCESCTAFAEREAVLERKLEETLAVEVPDDLVDRIKMRQGIVHEVHEKHVRPWKYAMAASVFLVVVIASFFGYQTQRLNETESLLQQAVLQHINDELHHLGEQNNVKLGQVNILLSPLGGHASEGLGKVNFANRCEISHHVGVHLVLAGKQGPVTVLYIPHEHVARDSHIENSRFDGVLFPAGQGVLAIVGERGEKLGELTERLRNNITWDL